MAPKFARGTRLRVMVEQGTVQLLGRRVPRAPLTIVSRSTVGIEQSSFGFWRYLTAMEAGELGELDSSCRFN